MKLQPTPVKAAALALGLPVLQPEKASHPEFVEQLGALAPERIIVVAYGQILRPAVLNLPPGGCINVHGSLLPELRGAGPIQWAILRGYSETGVTTMFMDPGMDTGAMLLKAALPILPTDTAGTLAERLAPVGADLLVETLQRLAAGTLQPEPQDNNHATYAPLLHREDGALSWEWDAATLRNRIHGCNPTPGAFAARAGALVKIWRAEAVPDAHSDPPGTVIDAGELVLTTGSGALRLLEVQPENRSRVSGTEFARGYRVVAGERWEDGPITASATAG